MGDHTEISSDCGRYHINLGISSEAGVWVSAQSQHGTSVVAATCSHWQPLLTRVPIGSHLAGGTE